MGSDIRRAEGPKAQLLALEARARRAGIDSYDDAYRVHCRQFRGGRPYWCPEADDMPDAASCCDEWLFRRGPLPEHAERIESRLRKAFQEAWDAAADAE